MKRIIMIFLSTFFLSTLVFADPIIIAIPYSQGDEVIIDGTEFGEIAGSVKLCNGETYIKKGICKNQEIVKWSDTSITIHILMPNIINIRKEGDLRYSYLYVVNGKKEGTTPGKKTYLNP